MPALPPATAIAVLAIILCPLLARADDDPPPTATAAIGDLALTYDPVLWRVDRTGAATAIACIDYDCQGALVTVTMEPDRGMAGCSETAMLGGLGLGLEDIGLSIGEGWSSSRIVNGLVLHQATLDIGCRNLAGGPVLACTRHGGQAYVFNAVGEHCRTPFDHREIVSDLLSGLRPR